MRLTLRTLLAYLDDILEPAEAKEIGTKIADSSYATSLVGRIKDVVRRRRVAAPEISGPGSSPDPNIVAEYLDNTLPPEKVADLERVCLESDSHLAEVAACHQVLTLVLGEPVEIPAGMRERIYALGAVAPQSETNGSADATAHVPTVASVGAADVPRNTRPGSGEVTLEDRLPEALLPRKRSWVRMLATVVGIIVVGVWGYLVMNDEALTGLFASRTDEPAGQGRQEQQLSSGQESAASNIENRATVNVPETAADPAESSRIAAIPSVAVSPPDMTAEPPVAVEEGALIPADADVPPVTVLPDPEAGPPGDAVAAATPAIVPDPDALKPPPVDPPAEPALPPPHELQYISTTGVLLHNKDPEAGWVVLARRALIYANEEVATPLPFDATFSVGDGGKVAEIVLRGGTRVRSLGSSESGRFGFDVHQGRVLIHRKDSAPADEPVSLRVTIRKDAYRIDLLEPGTVVGVEVNSVLPVGEADYRGATRYEGGIAIVAGAASVETAAGQQIPLQPETGWLPFAAAESAPPSPEPLVSLPNWLDRQRPAASAITRRYAALYEDEFIADQPISQSIRPVVKDRRPPLAELATKTLAICGSYPGLVDALSSQHEEARLAAILGLKAWLSFDPEHGEQLRTELQNRFRNPEANAIYRLLWGFGEQNARNQIDSEDLVNWMAHDEIAIRELAFFHVHRLTDRRYDYQPDGPAGERAQAIERWREYVAKQGALIGS